LHAGVLNVQFVIPLHAYRGFHAIEMLHRAIQSLEFILLLKQLYLEVYVAMITRGAAEFGRTFFWVSAVTAVVSATNLASPPPDMEGAVGLNTGATHENATVPIAVDTRAIIVADRQISPVGKDGVLESPLTNSSGQAGVCKAKDVTAELQGAT
jgi:hypothetical protein